MADQNNVSVLLPIDIEAEMRKSYLDYAMSVIIARALPDVRDGLKPVQRRILVAMNDLKSVKHTSRIYTLSLHDALPISQVVSQLCDELDYRARVAGRARWIEAGAASHPGGDERSRTGVQPGLSQVREDLRRYFGQLSSARGSGDLSGVGSAGAGFQHALSADRRTRKFWCG